MYLDNASNDEDSRGVLLGSFDDVQGKVPGG